MTKHLNVYTLRDNKYTNRKCTRHFSRFYCRLSEGGSCSRRAARRRERAERSVVVVELQLLLPRPPPLPHDPLQLIFTSGHLEERNTGKNILRLFLFKTKKHLFQIGPRRFADSLSFETIKNKMRGKKKQNYGNCLVRKRHFSI